MNARALSHFERMITVTDDYFPLNVVVTVELTPAPDAESLRGALNRIQARHPALRARILKQRGYRFHFDVQHPIQVDTVHGYDQDMLRDLVETQLNMPFDRTVGPLVRCTFLSGVEKTTSHLIVCLHHAIADSNSIENFLKELFQHVSGQPLRQLPISGMPRIEPFFPAAFQKPRSFITILGLVWRQIKEEFRFQLFKPNHLIVKNKNEVTCRIVQHSLDAIDCDQLVQRARENGVTFNTALNAALAIAVHKVLLNGQTIPIRMINFANLRPYLSKPLESYELGIAISLIRSTQLISQPIDFWSFCKHYQAQLVERFKQGEKFGTFLLSDMLIKIVIKLKKFRLGTVALSYTGELTIPVQYGEYKINGIDVFISNNCFGPLFTAQALIFNDRLIFNGVYLDQDMSYKTAKHILEKAEMVLADQAIKNPTV